MKTTVETWMRLTVALAAATLLGCVKGEQTSQASDSTARNLTLAPTESTAALKDVPARAAEPAKAPPVRGTIDAAEPRPNPNSPGKLVLSVHSVTVRGTSYPVDASVVAMDTVEQGRGVTKADAAKVGAGAAAGAIVGKLLGKDGKGAVIGGIVGAGAGAAAARASRDIDLVLPKGAAVTLKLDKPLTVRRAT